MLTSTQNSLVKQIRRLHSSRDRHTQGLMLLEGTHLVQAAFAAQWPLETLCATPQWQSDHPDLWVQGQVQRRELVSPEVLQAMATTVTPVGVVATGPRSLGQAVPFTHLGLALETIQDPGNMGTIIRTAAAAAAEGLWVSNDSVDLDHPKVLRASAGLWFRLPMQKVEDLPDRVRTCQVQGLQVVATLPTGALNYWQVDWRRPTVILLGNEGAGLSPGIAALADLQVQVPLAPGVESLNVAVVAALMLYEAQRQRTTP